MKKNNLKISKNIKTAIVGGVLALVILFSMNAMAAIGTVITTEGNSGISLSKLQLAPKAPPGLDLSELDFDDADLNFRLYGTAVIDNIIGIGDAYFADGISVGYASEAAAGNIAELEVDGDIMIKELAHPDCIDTASCAAIADDTLCTNDFGKLMRCTDPGGGEGF